MTFMYKMRAGFCMMQRFARQHRASSIERVCHHVRFLLVIACHTYKEWTLSTRSGEGRLAEMFILSSRVHQAAFSCAKLVLGSRVRREIHPRVAFIGDFCERSSERSTWRNERSLARYFSRSVRENMFIRSSRFL